MRGKAGMFSSRIFSPDSISGLTGWWDASDASTLYSATTGGSLVAADGTVARLQDKSGNARHFTQSSSGSQPTRKTSVQNGLDVLRFNGTSSRFTNTATFSNVMSTVQGTVFIVCNATTVSTNNANVWQNASILSSSNNNGHQFVGFRSNGTAFSFGYDSDYRTASLSYTAGTWGAFTTRHGSSTLLIRLNGGSDASTTLGTKTFFANTMTIGLNADSRYFNGDLGELIIYDVALSDADRDSVETYLMTKWGI